MTTSLRLAGYQGDRSVHSRAMHMLCDALKDDGVNVRLEQNIVEQGHKASDLLTRTESGEKLITLSAAERDAFVAATRDAVMAMGANFDTETSALFERELARGPR